MITVEQLSFCYQSQGVRQQVLQDVSFQVKAGQSCAIIGPSGCGKSTLLFLLAGLLQAEQGRVRLAEGARCGTILQNYGLFPWKSVAENVALGLRLQKVAKAECSLRVRAALEEMGLAAFSRYYPGQLSGGMQQRVALARALVIQPDILLMDEPLSSLDALTRERLQNLILELWQERQVMPVVVTHSIEEAVFLGRRIIVLGNAPGRIIAQVENREAGKINYRQSSLFFQRCNLLRSTLLEECDVRQA
ncbi:ABC transporter ATP-binding protein [Desulfogranum mediterraneum]|uniref:ABC transporter ATP-binding protein n=1 Tax=Desulfogranum mediterraneum TaxID=160661 RepID=UPI000428FEC7|nr:ABC transporter ATP-binding protein [Desulfogranum mediterraneum]